MCCRTQKNHQIFQKLGGNEENLAIFSVILMAASQIEFFENMYEKTSFIHVANPRLR